jgi:hypothetical protein
VGHVVVVDGVEVGAFEAEVEEADVRAFLGRGIELDELTVVDLDEGLVGDAVFFQVEGLLEAEFFVEGGGSGEVVDADGYVGYSVEGRWGDAVGLGVDESDEEGGKDSDE